MPRRSRLPSLRPLTACTASRPTSAGSASSPNVSVARTSRRAPRPRSGTPWKPRTLPVGCVVPAPGDGHRASITEADAPARRSSSRGRSPARTRSVRTRRRGRGGGSMTAARRGARSGARRYPASGRRVLGIDRSDRRRDGRRSADACSSRRRRAARRNCATTYAVDLDFRRAGVFERGVCDRTIDPSTATRLACGSRGGLRTGDPHCCPSATGTTSSVYRDGDVAEPSSPTSDRRA